MERKEEKKEMWGGGVTRNERSSRSERKRSRATELRVRISVRWCGQKPAAATRVFPTLRLVPIDKKSFLFLLLLLLLLLHCPPFIRRRRRRRLDLFVVAVVVSFLFIISNNETKRAYTQKDKQSTYVYTRTTACIII